MMKRLIVMLILAALPGFLSAETVMLFARVEPPVIGGGANRDRFVAVEDGVEDQFYNAGHIIFDTGVPQNREAATEARSNGWAERVARSGGADFLLIVNLVFPESGRGVQLPSKASYELVDLRTGSTLAQGNVLPSHPVVQKTKKPYDLYFAFGQRIAREAIDQWGPIP